jgi:FkbM family methyltransferase
MPAAGHAATTAKKALRRALHAAGFELSRFPPPSPPAMTRWGLNAQRDIARLLADVSSPTVFDVGANTGQSVAIFRELLPGCVIHSFEPSPSTFIELEENVRGLENVRLVNAGIGSDKATRVLFESSNSAWSSFLQPTIRGAKDSIVGETEIAVITLDDYCRSARIDRIDLLKIDTQGYELEVLRGSAGLIAESRIRLIYLEMAFWDLYEGRPPFDVLYRALLGHGFRLVALYDYRREKPSMVAGECDGLFALHPPGVQLPGTASVPPMS